MLNSLFIYVKIEEKFGGDFVNKWMSFLPNAVNLSQINLPGTHDSCTYRVQFPFISKCQNKTIKEQLNSGIRFLDIRVEKDENKLKLVHGIADCKNPENQKEKLYLEDVINDCKYFLSENSSETILLSYKRDHGANQEETFDTFFENYLNNDSVWYTENRIPALKEVRGKIVLLNRDNIDKSNEKYTDFNTGINLSTWVCQKENIERIYEVAELFGRDGTLTGKTFTVQDLYGLTPQKKWNLAINPFIKNPPKTGDILITFFSCSSLFYTPKRSAKFINKKLEKETLKNTKKYGWIIMDYPTEKFIKDIIKSNF